MNFFFCQGTGERKQDMFPSTNGRLSMFILVKATGLRVNLNIDDTPIDVRFHLLSVCESFVSSSLTFGLS